MKITDLLAALGALAHEHRLAIYRLLVKYGPEGLPAGVIGQRLGVLPSTLTFHLHSLQRSGLLAVRRVSRQLIYSADFDAMNALLTALTDNCCLEGEGAPARPRSGAGCRSEPRGRREQARA